MHNSRYDRTMLINAREILWLCKEPDCIWELVGGGVGGGVGGEGGG